MNGKQKSIRDFIQDKRKKISSLSGDITRAAKDHIPKFSMMHTIGTWDCEKSPIGLCVYDEWEDPACDDCMYCHEPDERK